MYIDKEESYISNLTKYSEEVLKLAVNKRLPSFKLLLKICRSCDEHIPG